MNEYEKDTRTFTCSCGRRYILYDDQDNPAFCPCEVE